MKWFFETMKPTANTTILDVGGYPSTWESMPIDSPITTLNVHPVERPSGAGSRNIQTAVGDGCNLPYRDQSFDIVYSNSVIEHLSTIERQRAFAREVRRVGKALWVQTPARSFLVEPHLMAPFIHFLPTTIQKKLAPFTPWALIGNASSEEIEQYFREVRLISKSEFSELFPDCEIRHERFAGLTKSFIAVRTAPTIFSKG